MSFNCRIIKHMQYQNWEGSKLKKVLIAVFCLTVIVVAGYGVLANRGPIDGPCSFQPREFDCRERDGGGYEHRGCLCANPYCTETKWDHWVDCGSMSIGCQEIDPEEQPGYIGSSCEYDKKLWNQQVIQIDGSAGAI